MTELPLDDASEASAEKAAQRSTGQYLVIARRYRPQTFEELVGQEHVGRVLAKAITTDRVGHAYLFTGARGVGKTSAARIFAKALNCVEGPTPTPCNRCDICARISMGEDVDVLEIDGASNRGIDEIRELRQNVGVRPSRARYKIYIIDEVHMLTREAFNALLKTLEEPPPHTKFIFCTTEAHKIPITILSRCQRFDFNGMQTRVIAERLRQIVENEGVEAEPAALEVLARRAAGSMRDGQSLLEQMLAFCDRALTVADVQKILGTASDERVASLIELLAERETSGALAELDGALVEGADLGQLLDQLIGHLRDAMITLVGCPSESLLHTTAAQRDTMAAVGEQFGLETLLAVMQILEQAKARMRTSTHARTLAELAIVRICQLGNLDEIGQLVAELRGEAVASPPRAASLAGASAAKKNVEAGRPGGSRPAGTATTAASTSEAPGAPAEIATEGRSISPEATSGPGDVTAPTRVDRPLTAETAPAIWKEVLANLSDMFAQHASLHERLTVRNGRLLVGFPAKYGPSKAFCERPERLARLEEILARVTGQRIRLEFELLADEAPAEASKPAARPPMGRQKLMEKAQHPFVRRAAELFDAQIVQVDEAEPSPSAEPSSNASISEK